MGTELRRAQCAKQAKRKSNEQRRLASGSVARRLLRIVGTRERRKRACEHPKARRAEVVSTRSKAQCAATEHRAAKGGTVRRCGTTMPNCGPRPKGVRSAGTPRRREGGQRPTRPRQFGGRSPEICRAVPARRQRRVRGRNRRGRCEDTEHRASEVQGGAKTQDDYAELRSWHTTRQRNFTQPALSQRKETGLVLLCVYYSPTMANRPLSMSSAS